MKKCTHPLLMGIVCLCLSMAPKTLFASHIVGADLRYQWVSDSTYKVILMLYGDCSSTTGSYPTLAVATPQICIFDGGTSVSNITLTLVAPLCGFEVTPLCPGDTSTCTAITHTIPGINRFTYTGTYTLPHASAVWRFVYEGNNGTTSASYSCPGTTIGTGTGTPAQAGRTASITNLTSAGATEIQLIDTLNSTIGHNTSADLTVAQQTFFCNNSHDEYDPGVTDPDGDSVYISLIAATNGTGACGTVGGAVSYSGNAWPGTPLSGDEPLQVVADSFSINHHTGRLSFHPNVVQRSVVVYNVDEYRLGVKVGTSQREMTVLAITCGLGFPCGSPTLQTAENELKNYVDIYPNPAGNELNIRTGDTYSSFTITDVLGRQLSHGTITGMQNTIDIHSLPAGVLYISLDGKNGTVTRNFVKK